jgi:periplasmic protein TonB
VAVVAALLLHIAVLAGLIVLPSHRLEDDKAPQTDVVTLMFQPPAEAPPDVIPPTEAPPPEPQPPPLPPEAAVPVPDIPLPLPPPQPEATVPVPAIPPPPAVPRPKAARPRPAAPAPTEAPRAPSAEPPPPATAAPSEDVLGPYRNILAAHLRPYRRYPALARSRREEGMVVVHVTVQRDGRIVAMSIEHGSGFDQLDREALATLKRADPLPPIPPGVPGTTMELAFPISFQME